MWVWKVNRIPLYLAFANHPDLMKRFIQTCIFLVTVAAAYSNPSPDSLKGAGDTTRFELSQETAISKAQVDSLERAYYIVLHSLRLQNEQLERAVVRSGRIIAVLFIVLVALGIMITLLSSRRTYFASFPYFRQKKGYQPGIVCLQMMHKYYYGKRVNYKSIVKNSALEGNPNELTLEDMVALSGSLGFDARVVRADLGEVYQQLRLPVIVYMPNHMAVLYALKDGFFHLSDPYYGFVKLNHYYFATSWFVDEKSLKGIAIQLFPQNKARNSVVRKLSPDRFNALKSIDKKSLKNYVCELDMAKTGE